MASHFPGQVSTYALDVYADFPKAAAARVPGMTVMTLRPSLPAPPLGRKPDFTPPTQLLDLERRKRST